MMAGPSDPGVGENLYQPASSYDVPDGTWTEPSAFNPRDRSDEWTPIDGMSRATGFDRGSTSTIVEVGLTRGFDDGSTERQPRRAAPGTFLEPPRPRWSGGRLRQRNAGSWRVPERLDGRLRRYTFGTRFRGLVSEATRRVP
jgi:hypothetical protein